MPVFGAIAIILIVILLFSMTFNRAIKINNVNNPELARAMEYPKVSAGEDGNTGSDYVKFDAFFLRDLDEDGYADKIRGTCEEITQTDTLYINLNVLTNGTLEDGEITIQGQNINFKTAIVEDDVIEGNYIAENTTSIKLKNVEKGTQKLIYGTIKAPSLGTDTNKYSSSENKIILTGTHRDENGQTTDIHKEVNFTVDWYASVGCIINDYTGYLTGAQNIEEIKDETGKNMNLSFYIQTKEDIGLSIISSSYLKGTIPPLNNHMPNKVEITGTDITFDYERETGKFVAKRLSERNESKIVTKTVPRYNTYNFVVTYPIEAYEELGSDTVSIQVQIEAYYEGYNNPNEQFTDPQQSNVVNKTLGFLWRKLDGDAARFDVTVGKYRGYYENERYRGEYVISKKEALKIYNKTGEETKDTYEVMWYGSIGSQVEVDSIQMQEQKPDEFLTNDNQRYTMSNYTKYIGIYFDGAEITLQEDGYIDVKNDEDGSLIHRFTKDDWNLYNSSNPFKYNKPVARIRIETSKVNKNSGLSAYNIKEIDDNELNSQFDRTQFDKLQDIYSYVTGKIKLKDTEEYADVNTDESYAIYEEPISTAIIKLEKDTFGTQKEEKDVNITISTLSSYYNMEKWTNGRFLVKLPEEILELKINNVTPSDMSVHILAYEIVEIDNQKFIKIETENEVPVSYNITINCTLIADPRMITQDKLVELYAINENYNNYKNKTDDTYDIDGDENVVEQVNYFNDAIYFVAPSSLLTNQEATNYNSKGEMAVAPQIAKIDKEEANTANINVSITNNYENAISEIKIVGKIPTKNNTFVINRTELGSNFDTTMIEKIQVPEDLKDQVTVYYSDQEDVSEELTDEHSNWRQDLDISKVKSYLIYLGSYKLPMNNTKTFSYKISIPETVKYNDISYSTHAVYFCLNTTGGKFKTETETSKLGFSIERKYNLSIEKLKQGTQTPVQGSIFAIMEEGEEQGKIGTTNAKGIITIEDLYVDRTYVLKEIRTPSSYEKNTMEYRFKVKVSEDEQKLELEEISGHVLETNFIQASESDRGILNIKVENTPKYQLILTKKEQGQNNTISNVMCNLKGGNLGDNGITVATDNEGKLTISGLSRETEYTLTEVSAKGYYLMEEPIVFKLTNNGGNLQFNEVSGHFANTAKVTIGTGITGTDAQDKVEVELENGKIPTYSITLKKYGKDAENTLSGAQYKIEGEGIKENGETYTTGQDGKLTIEGLYEYIQAKPKVTGEYKITEIAPPEGYSLNPMPLRFKVQRDEVEGLKITIMEGTELIRLLPGTEEELEESKQDITIEDTNIQIGLTDEPLFMLKKVEKGTQTPIPNTKFKLIEIDESYEEIGPAQDTNGDIIGEEMQINEETVRVVTTDENGVISYGLKSGLYKAVEIQSADGYVFPENEEQRTYYFGIGESKQQTTEQGVSFAKEVSSVDWNNTEIAKKTQDNGIITAGYFIGNLDLDGDGIIDITESNRNYAGFIAKYTKNGELIFGKNITCQGIVKPKDIIQTQDGGYIVVGYFKGLDLKVNEQSTDLTNDTTYEEGFVIKLSEEGNYVWSKKIEEETKNIRAVTVVEDNNRNIIIGANTAGVIKSESSVYFYEGNPKIIKFNADATSQESTEIQEEVDIEDMIVTQTNGEIIILSSNKKVTTTSTIGRIDKYLDGEITGTTTVQFNPAKIVKLNTGKYVIAGNYMGTAYDVASTGLYDGIIVDYDGETLSNERFIKGPNNDVITSISATSDEGFIIGAYSQKGGIDLNNDGNNEIESIVGNTDSIIIKYNSTGDYESYKQIQGAKIEEVNSIIEMKANEYIAVGYSNSKEISANVPNSEEINLELSDYANSFILGYGEVVTDPEIPTKSEIEVENELKKYTITTEIKLLEDQKEKGGTITGDSAIPIEVVEYGKNSTIPIEIRPNPGYKILSITINDEEYQFTPDGNGNFTLPIFEKIASNKHVVVTFSNTVSSIIVHHYLDGTQDLETPIRIAPDERKTGQVGENYTTEPYTESDKYELKRGENGQIELPQNKSGQYTVNEQEVIYLYQEKKIPLIVHHYIEGTENPVELANGDFAEDITTEEIEGTAYTTEALKPYDDAEVDQSKKLAQKYELARMPLNAQGNYKAPKVEVTYEYKVKTYNIITKVKTHTETNEYGDEQQVEGGGITGANQNVYETVEYGESNKLSITATPAENYKVKSITLNNVELVKDRDYTSDEETGTITLNPITNITENQTIEVEFEKIQTLVVVNHYIYDKKSGQKTKNPVLLSDGQSAESEEIYGPIGEMYVTNPKEDLIEGYILYEEPGNISGYRTKETIYVDYYYAIQDAEVEQKLTKDGTQVVVAKDEEINYTISYEAVISKYEGNAVVTIVDTLPYALDKDKMKELATNQGIDTSNGEEWLNQLLDGGVYEEKQNGEGDTAEGSTIYTITWALPENNINTSEIGEELQREPTITINKHITVLFKGLSIKQPGNEQDEIFTNKVKATIKLEETSQEIQTPEITHDTRIEFIKNMKVEKIWDHGSSIYERPKEVTIQIKVRRENGEEEIIQSYTLSEENNWTHTFTGLAKYDEEGNEIKYIIDEVGSDGQNLEYYRKTIKVNGEIIEDIPDEPPVFELSSEGETYPWTLKDDGTWQSGGYHQSNAVSRLKSNEFTLKSDGSISFDWAVSSQLMGDYLYYSIRNVNTGDIIGGNENSSRISGSKLFGDTYENLSFENVKQQLTKGTYVIEFVYQKNGLINSGQDAGFIKNVSVEGM